tara:strand:- start:485 stop:1255 length:771 start_codon:yes stop_codon:yes gene_type:complete
MTIETRVKFYYDYVIDSSNQYLNFSEGAAEITAVLAPGRYSFTTLAGEVAQKLSISGNQDYTVATDRINRKYTISAVGDFEILASSGSNFGLSAWSRLGFDDTDLVGTNAYEAQSASGSEYIPQFIPQNFIRFEHWKEFAEAKINESSSGVVELYSIGTRQFMQMDLKYSTDIRRVKSSPIEDRENGISDLISFLDYAITKGDIEYMEDRDLPDNFISVILESTSKNKNGVGYQLKENKQVPGYFDTGILKFRKKV